MDMSSLATFELGNFFNTYIHMFLNILKSSLII